MDYGNLKVPENVTPEVQTILDSYKARNKEIGKNHLKNMGRIGLGSVLSGASAHPVFNIPYIGTGLGGALYELGQGITEGDKLPELAKRTGAGFAIGETVGAIPYVGKGANKLSGGKIGNAFTAGIEKLASTPLGQKVTEIAPKVEDLLMTDITGKLRKGYHGTKYKGNIEKFDENLIGTNTGNEGYSGRGFYFSTDPYEASTYGDNILTRYIETKKPFIANRENIAKYAENFGYSKEPIAIDKNWLLNSLKTKDTKAYNLANEIIKNGEEKGWDNFLAKFGGEDDILNLDSVANWANATKLSNNNYKEPLSDYIINDLTENLGIPKTINDFKYLPTLDYMLDLGNSSRAFTDMLKKDGYDSVINGTEIVAFSPEQIKTSLYDYLVNDSILSKGFRQNKDIIDKNLLEPVRKVKNGLNIFNKTNKGVLYDEIEEPYRIAEAEKILAQDIERHLKGEMTPSEMINFGKPSILLKNLGTPDLEMHMPQHKYDMSTERKMIQNNIHKVPDEIMKKIPTLLTKPKYVFKSSSKGFENKRFVVQVDAYDKDNNPVFVIVDYSNPSQGINIIPSIYGKEQYNNFINKNIDNIVYKE